MSVDRSEVLLGLLGGGGTQTFVVLDLEVLWVSLLSDPLLIFRNREEGLHVGKSLVHLYDRCHELLKKTIKL